MKFMIERVASLAQWLEHWSCNLVNQGSRIQISDEALFFSIASKNVEDNCRKYTA